MAQKRKSKIKMISGREGCSDVMRRKSRRIWYGVVGAFVMAFVFGFLVAKYKDNNMADAANLGAFDAGYIISDYQMSNYGSMSEGDIQNFLKQHGNCNDTRTYLADYYTSYSYHIKDGHFVCLADETFGNGTAYGNSAPYGESAAHIIWQAAQDYRINPQVLIVLLQKEQGLITDSWPNNIQYRSATGYGCPDTAACDSQYYGFKNQVRKAAAMFRSVLDGGWTNYPLGQNYVQYNPNSACGGSWVNIRSLATSALYRYTPYQPNAFALAAGYGSGDSCGAYGNRNFYLYFEDWFGGITESRSQDDIINDKIRSTFDTSFDYSGTYNIVYSSDYNRNIGVEGDNVAMVRNSGIRWKIEKIDDYYIIRNTATGKVLDVSGASFSNKTNVWQYELNKTCAQRWSFVENKDGTVTIHNACYPQYVLDLQGGDTNIQIYKKTDYENDHQKWVLKEINNKDYTGVYNIGYSKNQNKVVGVVDGNNVTVSSKSRDNTQQWKIEKIDDYYIIRNVATGKVLDVSGASFSNKTNVWQYELNKTCAQRWSFVENKDGTVTIHNACYPQYVLDLQGGDTNIQIYKKTDYENDHQKWVLKEI